MRQQGVDPRNQSRKQTIKVVHSGIVLIGSMCGSTIKEVSRRLFDSASRFETEISFM